MKLSRLTMGPGALPALGLLLLIGAAPAEARGGGPKMLHTQSVGQIAVTSFVFGGPAGCDPATGAGCTFYDLGATVAGQSTPFGPYRSVATATVLFSQPISNGGHDADGNPTEFCAPELGSEVMTFADGSTLSSDFQGLSCCANANCSGGPPRVNHDSSVVTAGTGRFSGAQGGWTWSDSLGPTGVLLEHAEGVLQLP